MITIFSILSLLFISVFNQPQLIQSFVSIQNTSEVFLAYLPYFSTCDYNSQNFISGQVEQTELTPSNFYQFIIQEDMISFWTTVRNGLDIAYKLPQSITGYTGYILYDSQYQKFNRNLILFKVNQSGLFFNYTFVTINTQTMLLIFNVVTTKNINLKDGCNSILTNCNNISSQNFAFLGNDTFIFVCGQDNSGFIFNPVNNTSQVINLSNLPNGNYQVAPNPNILNYINQKIPILWSGILMITDGNQSSIFFIVYEQKKLSILTFQQYAPRIVILLDLIWGSTIKKQSSKWLDIINSIPSINVKDIQGDLVSLYISKTNNVYIESLLSSGLTNLYAFNSQQMLWNITIEGSVIYYGQEQTFIYNNQTIYQLSINRPIYLIYPQNFINQTDTFNLSYLNFIIPCQNINITIKYLISWSNIDFPIGSVYVKSNNNITSQDSVYAVQVSDYFIIIGPNFQIVPNSSPNLQVSIYSYKNITINAKAIQVINIQYSIQNSKGVFIITTSSIYFVTIKGKLLTLATNPCGFNAITQAVFTSDGQISLTNSTNSICLCQVQYFQCNLYTLPQTQKTQSSYEQAEMGQNSTILYKKILFNLVKEGYIIFIYANNTVALVNKTTQQTLSLINFQCPAYNITNGIVSTIQYQLPSIVLFCEGNTTLSQYYIYKNQFYLQRVIPIYGFTIRSGQYVIRSTQTKVFLAVAPIYYIPYFPQNCCVLKLDLSEFTVSIIEDIIESQQVIATATNNNFDFVLLSSITSEGFQTLINIYLPQQWIQFNMTSMSESFTFQQQIKFYFISPVYNLAAFESILISFNMSQVNITMVNQNRLPPITLYPSKNNQYELYFSYNLSSYFCGPIFDFFFDRISIQQKNIEINQENILKKSKIVGTPWTTFIQIIDPQQWKQSVNNTLNGLLLFISETKIYIYAKVYQNIQLYHLADFQLPLPQCTYYPYKINNQTAMQFTSSCFGYELDFNLSTPIITINFNPNNSQTTFSYRMLPINFLLKDIQTIPLDSNHSMVFGILQGPMLTTTGRLVMCLNSTCSPLYISSKQSFLIGYSFYENVNPDQTICESYFIMILATSSIGIYINPTVQPDNQKTNPNYTFYYLILTQQPCSAITIVNATLNFAYMILSSSNYYYYIFYNYSSNHGTIKAQFSRYSQCGLLDDFPVQFIYEQGKLEGIFAQCRQNDYFLQTNAYQGFKNNSDPVYTGYLQVYIMTGPLGPNCSPKIISPSRLIPLSVSMARPLFMVYNVLGKTKFIYSESEGFLVDNYVYVMTEARINFRQGNINEEFPSIALFAGNQFKYLVEQIFTRPQQQILSSAIDIRHYILAAFFLLLNTITVIFYVLYLRNRKKVEIDFICEQMTDGDGLQYQEDRNTVSLRFKDRQTLNENNNRQQSIKPRQIQMFFIKTSSIQSQL